MKRVLVVYNPYSSQYAAVKKEVLDRLGQLKGCIVGKYRIEKVGIDENVTRLAGILADGDMIVSAGGDATGVIASNAILRSGREVSLAVLPYGNFNDLARTLGLRVIDDIWKASSFRYYPLEINVDGKLERYATCYATVGMMAESVKMFDSPSMRRRLKSEFGRRIGGYFGVAGWYFKNRRKKDYLPEFILNGEHEGHVSDYFAVNGRYLARVMKGNEDFLKPRTFQSGAYRLTGFWKLMKFMIRSILKRVPGKNTKEDKLEFVRPANVVVQAEGEGMRFKNVSEIEIRKSEKYIRVFVL